MDFFLGNIFEWNLSEMEVRPEGSPEFHDNFMRKFYPKNKIPNQPLGIFTQEKIPNPSYSRRSPPSSFSNLTRTLTLILSGMFN